MNLKELSVMDFHKEAMLRAKKHDRSVSELLLLLEVAEERKHYLEFELPSLYQYCTHIMNLDSNLSYSLIAVIHKGKEVPELKAAVIENRVTLSKAKKICSVITTKDQKQWIELAMCETSRIIEKCVAQANPKTITPEISTYKTADHLEYKLGVSEEWMDLLKQTKDLLAQRYRRHVDGEEALQYVMQDFIERNDPVKKAERAQARAQKLNNKQNGLKNRLPKVRPTKDPKPAQVPSRAEKPIDNQQVPGLVNPPNTSDPRSRKVRTKIQKLTLHQVNLRDQNRCTFSGARGRCEEKRWLDSHHVISPQKGGSDEFENLTTLCRAHHQWHHLKSQKDHHQVPKE